MGLPASLRLSKGDLSRASGAPRVRQSSGPVTVTAVLAGLSGIPTGRPVGGRQRIRVGFAIGRPVGGAVVRNLLRRRLRAGVRRLLHQTLPTGGGVTLVVVRVTPAAASMSAADLDKHLERALRRCLRRASQLAVTADVL